ncbi:hypothetical protein COLO4_08266 [Corchorus olitorius]|uniref:Uncharacterized protein n=1 Tax=Corchorus olitorius TaxID=93759 RepID=A0A1R3KGH5_9ROSI|nr:hypothetical protein COLO4_08266 [Corchorus olitorius]
MLSHVWKGELADTCYAATILLTDLINWDCLSFAYASTLSCALWMEVLAYHD